MAHNGKTSRRGLFAYAPNGAQSQSSGAGTPSPSPSAFVVDGIAKVAAKSLQGSATASELCVALESGGYDPRLAFVHRCIYIPVRY